MKRKLSGEGVVSNFIKRYFSKSEDSNHMLPLGEVLSAYSGAVFLVLTILFAGAAIYLLLTGEIVPGVVVSIIGILLVSGSIYRNNIFRR